MLVLSCQLTLLESLRVIRERYLTLFESYLRTLFVICQLTLLESWRDLSFVSWLYLRAYLRVILERYLTLFESYLRRLFVSWRYLRADVICIHICIYLYTYMPVGRGAANARGSTPTVYKTGRECVSAQFARAEGDVLGRYFIYMQHA